MGRRASVLAFLVLATSVAPSGAGHEDGFFEQPVWFFRDSAQIEVLVVPPNHGQVYNGNGVSNGLDPNEQHPLLGTYLRAVERSIGDYARAVAEHGAPYLAAGLELDVYVLGRDDVPDETLRAPEIVVTTDEIKATPGTAVATHPCVVSNSKVVAQSLGYADMYNVNGHEFGHCLGLAHVAGDVDHVHGDAYRGNAHDVMNGSYRHDMGAVGTELHCVSNLNVRGLDEVFRRALTGETSDGVGAVQVTEYQRPASSAQCS